MDSFTRHHLVINLQVSLHLATGNLGTLGTCGWWLHFPLLCPRGLLRPRSPWKQLDPFSTNPTGEMCSIGWRRKSKGGSLGKAKAKGPKRLHGELSNCAAALDENRKSKSKGQLRE